MAVSSNVFKRLNSIAFVSAVIVLMAAATLSSKDLDSLMSAHFIQQENCEFQRALETARLTEGLATSTRGSLPDSTLLDCRIALAESLEEMDHDRKAITLIDTGIVPLAKIFSGGYARLGSALLIKATCLNAIYQFESADSLASRVLLMVDREEIADTTLLIRANVVRFVSSIMRDKLDDKDRYRKEVARLRLAKYGRSSVEYGYSLLNRASYHENHGSIDLAMADVKSALTTAESEGARGKLLRARAIFIQATVLRLAEQYSEALTEYQRAMQLYTEMYGPVHHTIVNTLIRIGWIQSWFLDFDEAEFQYQMASDMAVQMYGKPNGWTTDVKSYKASLLTWSNDYDSALVLVKEHYDETLIIYGEGSSEAASAKIIYAKHLLYVEREREAGDLIYDAIDIFDEIFDRDHRAFVSPYRTLASYRIATGDNDAAAFNLEKAREICREWYGPYHSRTADIHKRLGMVYRWLGWYRRSEKELMTAVFIYKRNFGEKSRFLLSPYKSLVATYKAANIEDAEEEFLEKVEELEKLYPKRSLAK